tara:strand:+ start:4242 stop:5123 length:882 start_codon:yes stop_codon:yes gene_type:complete
MKFKTGLGLHKIYIKFYVFFKNVIYIFWSIFSYILLTLYSSNSYPNFKRKTYILGSGPSLDKLTISNIKNSTVLLLNNSWQIHDQLDNSNQTYFMCGDIIGTLNYIADDLPDSLQKIIIPTQMKFNLNVIKLIIKMKKKKDYLFKINFHSIIKNKRRFNLVYDSKLNTNKFGFFLMPYSNLKKLDQKKNTWFGPHSVMFASIIFAYNAGSNEIFCGGFDGTNYSTKNYSNLLNLDKYKRKYINANRDTKNIERKLLKFNLWSSHICKFLNLKNVKVYNISKNSKITALPFKEN